MSSTSSIPLKPPPATDVPASIKGPATRHSQPSTKQSATVASVTGAASSAPAQSPIPAKPPTQPRAPRGASSLAGQALAAAGANKDKTMEARPPADGLVSVKSPAPSTGKPAISATHGKPSPAPGTAKTGELNESKAVEGAEKKADGVEKAVPMVNGASSTGDKIERHDEGGEKGLDRDVSTEEKTSSLSKRSLYVKGIPIPTTQDELKALFDSSDKARDNKRHKLSLTTQCR